MAGKVEMSVVSSIAEIEAEWDELADRVEAVPFLRPSWIRCWARAFGTGDVEVHTVRRDGRLVALVPLHRPAVRAPAFKTEPFPLSARPGTLRATANWQSPKFGPLATDAAAAEALARGLFARRPPLVSLAFTTEDHGWLEEWRAAALEKRYRVLTQALTPAPYVAVEEDWEAFTRRLDGKLLRDLRRRERRLREEASVTVEVSEGRERLHELLDDGFGVEHSGWKLAKGSAIDSRPATRGFYTEISEWAAEQGWLRLAFLRRDDRAIAFQLGIEHGGVYYFLKGGFDPDYSRFAPAKLLVQAMLARAFSVGLTRFDFVGGAEPWKLEWTGTCQERLLVHASAPGVRGELERLVLDYARPARAAARRRLRSLRSRA
jgi:CelD/BcsL family acetyltransferase involved in cellulose biosynthesis